MVPFAVGAFCPCLLAFLEGLDTNAGGVASTAYCTSLQCGALSLVMPEPLAVEAPQRFLVEFFGIEDPPYAEVDFGWDGSCEGEEDCLGVLTSLAGLPDSLLDIWEIGKW